MKLSEITRPLPRMKGVHTTVQIKVQDRDIAIELDKHDARLGYEVVLVDAHKFDKAFQQDTNFYVGPQGAGGIGKRYENFGKWLQDGDSMIASTVDVLPNGKAVFTNGRHRYAYLRDQDLTRIPVAMDKQSLENAHKHKLL